MMNTTKKQGEGMVAIWRSARRRTNLVAIIQSNTEIGQLKIEGNGGFCEGKKVLV